MPVEDRASKVLSYIGEIIVNGHPEAGRRERAKVSKLPFRSGVLSRGLFRRGPRIN